MVDLTVPSGVATAAGERSSGRWALRRDGRSLQPLPRVAGCGLSAIGEAQVVAHADAEGRAGWTGTQCCGRWHSCPVCAPRIATGRAKELAEVAERNRKEHKGDAAVWMLSLTLRHSVSHALVDLRDVLRQAWRYFTSGRRAEWKRAIGARGIVRALEATHGEHGWHLHIHAMVPGTGNTCDAERIERDLAQVWAACVEAAVAWCEVQALDAGETEEGVRCRFDGMVPDFAHGLKLSHGSAANYIAKLGWEVAGSWKKEHKRDNVSPWELLERAIAGDTRSAELWVEWSTALHCQRALTWSRGLRPERDVTDAALALREEAPQVARLDAPTYRMLERYGKAWDFARWLYSDPAAAVAWCTEHGHGLPMLTDAVRFRPRERLTPLELAPRHEPRDVNVRGIYRRTAARYSAVRGLVYARRGEHTPQELASLKRLAKALDGVLLLARGEWIPVPPEP